MNKELPGLSTMNLKMDLIHFQDEILKDIRQMQSKLNDKYSKSEEELNESLTKYDLRIKNIERKLGELSNLIITDNSLKEKVETIFQFKEEVQDTIFKRRAKFAEFEKKVNNDIDVINKILSNTVLYPSMIGKTAKFKTFHEFIDFTNQEITKLNIFKTKSGMDLTPYKKKIEESLEAFKIQINNLTPKEITNQMVNDLELKITGNLKIFDDRLQQTRIENSHYSFGIKKLTEEMNKQIENLKNMQRYINKKLEKMNNMDNYNILSHELLGINNKINKILDILRELVSYHPDVKRNFQEMEKKPTKKIISGVKQYIKGNLNAEELTSMKKFAFDEAESKIFDINSPEQKIVQNVSTESTFHKFPFQKRKTIYLDSKPINIEEVQAGFVNKNFMKKKTTNFSLTNKINNNNNININNDIHKKIEENQQFKRGTFNRKNTVSFGKNKFFDSSKINSNSAKKTIIFKGVFPNEEKENKIIEEENEINNNSNNSFREINDNKRKKSFEDENSKTDKGKIVDQINSKNDINNNDKIHLKQNEILSKKINSEEKVKTENNINNNIKIEESENEENNNVNSDKFDNKNKNYIEKKKITLDNKNNNINTEILLKENIKKEQSKILEQKEYKNNHTRNIKSSLIKDDIGDNDISLEPYTNKNIATKNQPVILKLNLKKNFKKNDLISSFSSENENHNPPSEGNKLYIPINYHFKPSNPNISIVSIKKKFYNTYSNFKVNHDSLENKVRIISNKNENYSGTKSENKYYKKASNTTYSFKYKDKLLKMDLDNFPLNYLDKSYKNIMIQQYLNDNKIERNKNNSNN